VGFRASSGRLADDAGELVILTKSLTRNWQNRNVPWKQAAA
jgi:hypothetical protein